MSNKLLQFCKQEKSNKISAAVHFDELISFMWCDVFGRIMKTKRQLIKIHVYSSQICELDLSKPLLNTKSIVQELCQITRNHPEDDNFVWLLRCNFCGVKLWNTRSGKFETKESGHIYMTTPKWFGLNSQWNRNKRGEKTRSRTSRKDATKNGTLFDCCKHVIYKHSANKVKMQHIPSFQFKYENNGMLYITYTWIPFSWFLPFVVFILSFVVVVVVVSSLRP